MQRSLLPSVILLSTLLLAPVFGEVEKIREKNATKETIEEASTSKLPKVDPTATITLQNGDLEKRGAEIDAEIKLKCQEKNYRSYIECLLRETKRKKRQCATGSCSGYQQQCYGTACIPVVQSQPCLGSGCIQIPQQPCSGFNCVFIGYNCYGNGCIQIGQTCYGIGCAPSIPNCAGPSCGSPGQPENETLIRKTESRIGEEGKGEGEGEGEGEGKRESYEGPTAEDVSSLRAEIEDIRDQLRLVKEQNDRLIEITEKATTLILANNNKSLEIRQREPVLIPHNLTTNIDINNYLNPTNVINVPKVEVQTEEPRSENLDDSERLETHNRKTEETRTHCCVVIRPKTCRTTSQAPYFICAHRKYRTCGKHCEGKRIVHSRVKPGCAWNSSEGCVSYHSNPYAPVYSGYPVSGYYPSVPAYYPVQGTPYYPVYYAQPPMPIYAPPPAPIYGSPPIYPSMSNNPYLPAEQPEEVEECENCENQISVDNCDETIFECQPVEEEKNKSETGNVKEDLNPVQPQERTLAADLDPINADEDLSTGPKNFRSNPLVALEEVKNEAAAIKRSEDQLAASLDMLEEAVELKRLEAETEKEKEAKKKSANDVETINATTDRSSFSGGLPIHL